MVDYAIFALDRTGRVLTWNPGAQRLKGYTASEIVGQHFSTFYPADVAASGFPARELEAAARDGTFEDEGWRVRKDGTRFWANVVITALRDESGETIGFAKVTRDLTTRRQAEETQVRLAASEAARLEAQAAAERMARLQNVTSRLAGLVAADDVAEAVLREGIGALNAAHGVLCLLAGSEELELVATIGVPEHVVRPYQRIALDAPIPLAAAVRTRQPVILENPADIARIAGDSLARSAPAEAWVAIPLLVGEEAIGAMALGFTHARIFNVQDRAFATSLGYQAALALERARLYAAEKKARAEAELANRVKSDFLATMSHELRTPLNAIGGYSQLLEMGVHGELSPSQAETIQRIRRSEKRLRSLIEDVLSFARLEAGRVELSIRPVKVRDLIVDVEGVVAPLLAAKQLTLSFAPPNELVAVLADIERAQQILLNLLSNAIKFSPDGSAIQVSVSQRGDRVAIAVRDEGIGIPADKLQAVFDPFVQVGRSLTARQEGSGLGLAISRNLAHAMGGELSLVSELGKGSVFTLILPSASNAASSDVASFVTTSTPLPAGDAPMAQA